MISHLIWDLGDTIIPPPLGGQDLQPLDQCPEIKLRPNVKDTLKKLSDSGFIHAVLSNTATTDSDSARKMLNRLGVEKFFEFVYATQSELTQDKPQKPDPKVFDIVLKALNVQPDQVIMIGNSWDNDALGANHSGIHSIWLKNPTISVRLDKTSPIHSPPWIIPVWDIANVPQAVETLQGVL